MRSPSGALENLQQHNIDIFEIRTAGGEFRLERGAPNPPYTEIIRLDYYIDRMKSLTVWPQVALACLTLPNDLIWFSTRETDPSQIRRLRRRPHMCGPRSRLLRELTGRKPVPTDRKAPNVPFAYARDAKHND